MNPFGNLMALLFLLFGFQFLGVPKSNFAEIIQVIKEILSK